jgi:hypothetical protein
VAAAVAAGEVAAGPARVVRAVGDAGRGAVGDEETTVVMAAVFAVEAFV